MTAGVPEGRGSGPIGARGDTPGLVRWVRPTRGYIVAATATGAVIALVGVGWQVAFLADEARRPPGALGWSLMSITVLLAGAGVMGWGAARPKPHVTGPDPGRPGDRAGRRAVRRAVWCAEPPRDPRLAHVAARRLASHDTSRIIAAFWLLLAGFLLGRGATQGADETMPPTSLGLVWSTSGLLILAAGWWPRWRLRRLDATWHRGSTGDLGG